MKTHGEKLNIVIRLILLAAVVAFCAFTTSCGGAVSGEVFYDINKNGIRDYDEPAAPFVRVLVAVDGEKKAEGFTMEDGTFRTALKRTGKAREICVMVDAEKSSEMQQYYAANRESDEEAREPEDEESGAIPIGDKLPIKGFLLSSVKLNTLDAEAGNKPPAAQKDDICKYSGKVIVELNKDDPDCVDADGDGIWDEVKKPADAQQKDDKPAPEPVDRVTIAGNKACVETKDSNVDMTIALSTNEQAAIASLTPPMTKECLVDKVCAIEVFLPKGFGDIITCTLVPPRELPSWLLWSAPKKENASQIGAKASSISASAAVTASETRKETVYLYVVGDQMKGKDQNFSLKFQAKCGDVSHSLPAIPIKGVFFDEPRADIIWSINRELKKIELKVEVKDEGSQLKNAKIFINVPVGLKVTGFNSAACQNHGMSMQCNVPLISHDIPFTVTMSFDIYAGIDYNVDTFKARVEADNILEPLTKDDVIYLPDLQN